jgi:hypothetical protein
MAAGADDRGTDGVATAGSGAAAAPGADATGADGPLQVALATMPGETHGDAESLLLIDALAQRGVRAALVPWDEERDWSK